MYINDFPSRAMYLNDFLALSHVPRWAIVYAHHRQSVADHSYRVAIIYLQLCTSLGRQATFDGLRAALLHDGEEARSGDIPGPFKRKYLSEALRAVPKPVHPTPDEAHLLKLADLLESWTWITKYGLGSHAERAAALVRAELIRECESHERKAVDDLGQAIIDEVGR